MRKFPEVNEKFLQVHFALFSLTNSESRQVFKMPRVDWCEVTSGNKNVKGMMKTIVDSVKESLPELIQSCPYSGHYEKFKVTIARKSLVFFPSGLFRIVLELFIDDKLVMKPTVNLKLLD
jgi:hypothetical protein